MHDAEPAASAHPAAPRAARAAAAVAAVLAGWTLLAWVGGALALHEDPVFRGITLGQALAGATYGLFELWPQLASVGACVAAAVLLFGLARGPATSAARRPRAEGLLDALLASTALLVGVAFEYPAVLLHPALAVLRVMTVRGALLALGVLLLSAATLRGLRARGRLPVVRHLASTLAAVAIGWAVARAGHGGGALPAARGARVLLGIDSLSQLDDVAALRDFARDHGGTWYERAVTPGLFTNAVWASILTSRPPSETGVYFVYQAPDWRALPANLVTRAHGAGLTTVSFFSDQFTTHVGSDLPFEVNRSGPRGWKQVVTAAVKNASVFLPVMLPHLPRLPFARTPRNQSGTFAYDLDRELASVLAAGGVERPAFVAGHLDYLHQPRYPSTSELDPGERAKVLAAPVRALYDDSLDWQYPTIPGEPLGLYRWKLERVQRAIAGAIERSGFLDPARRNQLVIFSDHGPRVGVSPSDFGNERFYRVVLLTFGTATRDPSAPISLLDVSGLLGLPAPGAPAAAKPVVEFANVTVPEWQALIASSRPLPDGGVDLDGRILTDLGRRLSAFGPYGGAGRYWRTPAVTARETRGRR